MATAIDGIIIQAAESYIATFGESATYYAPHASTARAISISVDRKPRARMAANGSLWQPRFEVQVLNSSTAGISASEEMLGGQLHFPDVDGGAAVEHQLPAGCVEAQDAGMLTIVI